MVNSTGQYKNLKMNQQDLDNIIELQKEANSKADNILFISVICQALLDATKPKVSNERTSITLNSDSKEEVRSKLNLILKRKRNEQTSKRN